jgi:hypothetical protein
MKDAVYKDSPNNFLELKGTTANFIRNIPPTEFLCAFANRIRHVDVQACGGLFQHLL